MAASAAAQIGEVTRLLRAAAAGVDRAHFLTTFPES